MLPSATNFIPQPQPAVAAIATHTPPTPTTQTNSTTTQPTVSIPHIILPDKEGHVGAEESAHSIAQVLRDTDAAYVKNGVVVEPDPMAPGGLREVCSTRMCSILDYKAKTFAKKMTKNGIELQPTAVTKMTGDVILKTKSIRHINKIKNCYARPVLSKNGETLTAGYHKTQEIFVLTGDVEQVDLHVAIAHLTNLICDFGFFRQSDKSRMLAAMLTPALRSSGVFDCLYPLFVHEADQPGAGKTLAQQLIAAIYAEPLLAITAEKAGVSKLAELVGVAMSDGNNFIEVDNVTKELDSDYLCTLLTTEDSAYSRGAYRSSANVQPKNHNLYLTTNGATLSRDLVDRSCIVRLRKQPADYKYKKFDGCEGLIQHVKKNQPLYLGCVHAVMRAWIKSGLKRVENETTHRMRTWAEAMDYIVTFYFDAAPLLDGHASIQSRSGSPEAVFVREVAQRCGGEFTELTCTGIYHIATTHGLKIGAASLEGEGVESGVRKIGWALKRLMSGGTQQKFDDLEVSVGGGVSAKNYSARLLKE